jgi:hypothetical protein
MFLVHKLVSWLSRAELITSAPESLPLWANPQFAIRVYATSEPDLLHPVSISRHVDDENSCDGKQDDDPHSSSSPSSPSSKGPIASHHDHHPIHGVETCVNDDGHASSKLPANLLSDLCIERWPTVALQFERRQALTRATPFVLCVHVIKHPWCFFFSLFFSCISSFQD